MTTGDPRDVGDSVYYSFFFSEDLAEGFACLLDRPSLSPVGGFEEGFFASTAKFRRHDGMSFAYAIAALIENPETRYILVSRNPRLVIDASLRERLRHCWRSLEQVAGNWALVSSGGAGLDEQNYCALYSAADPSISVRRAMRPIRDTITDLYLVDAEFAREFMAHFKNWPDLAFERELIGHGYTKGRISLFVPSLAAGVNGPLAGWLPSPLAAQSPASPPSSGQVQPAILEATSEDAGPIWPSDPLRRPPLIDEHALSNAIRATVAPYLARLSISIVTRTRFDRPHLLRRFLTSVSRARPSDADLEIILSTDAPMSAVSDEFDQLKLDFPGLSLRLVANLGAGQSRVKNMIGGIRAAANDYVWLVDDDDYIDLFAFDNLHSCLFLGSRPLIFAGAQSRDEVWDTRSPDYPVLSSSTPSTIWPATGWRRLFGGTNQVPICGAVIPRAFLIKCLNVFDFRFDLSEDYTLFLLLLSSPDLPEIEEVKSICSHISIRPAGENTVTVTDRSGWTRDIAGFLYDLTHADDGRATGAWTVLTGLSIRQADFGAAAEIARLTEMLAQRDRQIIALRRESEHFREMVIKADSRS
jgi:hypothetical protein